MGDRLGISLVVVLSFCVGRFVLFLFLFLFLFSHVPQEPITDGLLVPLICSLQPTYTIKLAIDLEKPPKTIITVRHELNIVLEIRRGSDVLVFEISRALRC